ncbi:MAG TPA: ATP-binding protein [Thermoleophilaceae bacterium]|nr:ATP-binding protein [Thermoleophilaceae bacterium]
MAATGFAWFAANFASDQALYLHRGPLVHLVLSYPYGRLGGRLERAVVAIAYAAAAVPAIWGSETATFVLSAVIVVAALDGYLRAVGRERRKRLAALWATGSFAAVLVTTAGLRLAFVSQDASEATLLLYEACLCALAGALLAGLLREPWARTGITDLVVDLGETRSGTLRDALADAVGDPTLEVGYRVGDGYVDAQGRPLALPSPGSSRRVTPVVRDGEPIAVLVHDPAVLDDPGLADALATAARLAASNARLQADVRAQLAELRASRRRLVHAGDEERRRLERRLHETVQRRLAELARELESRGASAARTRRTRGVEEQLASALDELQDLAAGLNPGGLSHRSLADALASLVSRSPVPVDLTVPGMRLPEQIATAAYFVCSEALANALKYASASRIQVSISERTGRLFVEVADDGVGGAVIGGGTGLRGLADRVEAVGGTIGLDSPPGEGTRLAVELPLADQTA